MAQRSRPAPPSGRLAELDADALAVEIDHRIRTLPAQTIQPIRGVRRAYSRRLRAAPAEAVAALAVALVDRQRWVAYERGGTGDTGRTLDICQRLVADRDDMVVKALSWALRELVVWDPDVVRRFLEAHDDLLAPRVRREVRNKLDTGLKHAPRQSG
jgi:DNA alkylation repair enzyme